MSIYFLYLADEKTIICTERFNDFPKATQPGRDTDCFPSRVVCFQPSCPCSQMDRLPQGRASEFFIISLPRPHTAPPSRRLGIGLCAHYPASGLSVCPRLTQVIICSIYPLAVLQKGLVTEVWLCLQVPSERQGDTQLCDNSP